MDLIKHIYLNNAEDAVVVDPLYLTEIRTLNERIPDSLSGLHLVQFIEQKAFPWSGGHTIGYVELSSASFDLDLSEIKSVRPEQEENTINKCERIIFATDSGLFIVVASDKLLSLSNHLDFDLLTSDTGLDETYLSQIQVISNIPFAVISTPGIASGLDFNGSGTYEITKTAIRYDTQEA